MILKGNRNLTNKKVKQILQKFDVFYFYFFLVAEKNFTRQLYFEKKQKTVCMAQLKKKQKHASSNLSKFFFFCGNSYTFQVK